MTAHEFTTEQILAGISHAIRERDFEVVPSLVKLLAAQDPRAAQGVLDAVSVARAVTR